MGFFLSSLFSGGKFWAGMQISLIVSRKNLGEVVVTSQPFKLLLAKKKEKKRKRTKEKPLCLFGM